MMEQQQTRKPRGVLNPRAIEKKFQLSIHAPCHDLALFIEQYWIVKWDLRGQPPYLSEVLSHPTVHLVFERDRSYIFGVVHGKFSYLLQNQGQAFGIKFKPAAFYPFIKRPVSQFTDSTLTIEEVFGVASKTLEENILGCKTEEEMVAAAEAFLHTRALERDDNVTLLQQIVAYISSNREITRVDNLVDRFNLSKRTLQRLFSQYVGVSPKWVIQRYRLHEAAEQLAAGHAVNWAKLAADLGYFDQAHFIKDFKAIVGRAPGEYLLEVGDDR